MLRQMADHPADSALMLRYRDGDAEAFDTLYERHRLSLFRFLARQTSDQQSCEDIYQEVWSKVIRARHDYRASAKFSTYLYRIARNCLIDHYRRVGRTPDTQSTNESATPELQAGTPDPADATEHIEWRVALFTALAQLPDEQREVFLLHEQVGLELAEIAEITGVGGETVKSRLRYARQKLRTDPNLSAQWSGKTE